jgi:hypothetical protein
VLIESDDCEIDSAGNGIINEAVYGVLPIHGVRVPDGDFHI